MTQTTPQTLPPANLTSVVSSIRTAIACQRDGASLILLAKPDGRFVSSEKLAGIAWLLQAGELAYEHNSGRLRANPLPLPSDADIIAAVTEAIADAERRGENWCDHLPHYCGSDEAYASDDQYITTLTDGRIVWLAEGDQFTRYFLA